jgi:multicomponent Na+:H+ antiporter subunit G
MTLMAWAGIVLVTAGAAAALAGAVGLVRFRHVLTRIHAASLADTGAAFLVLAGLTLMSDIPLTAVKIFFIWAFLTLTAPVASFALGHAAASVGGGGDD